MTLELNCGGHQIYKRKWSNISL